MKRLWLLTALGLALSGVAGLAGGWPSFAGGGAATAAQVAAVAVLRSRLARETHRVLGAWALGIGLRLAALIGCLALLPPLAGSLGFLGVLLPLLFTETLYLR